jgi:hypothetical protein
MASREPEWDDESFVELLRNLSLPDEELSKRLARSAGAVGAVRAGLKEYAKGRTETSLLSGYMRDLLRGREHYLQVLLQPET